MTSSTPKNSVKPPATGAYTSPTTSPFMTYGANRPASMTQGFPPSCPALSGHERLLIGRQEVDGRDKPGPNRGICSLQLALAVGVFAVLPFDELAVLHDVFGDHGHGVLAVVVEGDLADNRVAVLHVAKLGDHLLAVGTDLLVSVKNNYPRNR